MPRTRMLLRPLHELQVGDQRDLVPEGRLTAGERVVPVDPELGPVDGGLELDTEAHVPERVVLRFGDRAADLDGLRVALHRQLAGDADVVAGAADVLRLERDLRVLLRV